MRIPAASAGGASAQAGAQSAQAAQGAQAQAGAQSAGQAQQSAGVPTVKLSDIATIKDVKKAESISRTNGKDSIGISVIKANDANTVEVADNVKAELEQFKKRPQRLQIQLDIRSSRTDHRVGRDDAEQSDFRSDLCGCDHSLIPKGY